MLFVVEEDDAHALHIRRAARNTITPEHSWDAERPKWRTDRVPLRGYCDCLVVHNIMGRIWLLDICAHRIAHSKRRSEIRG